MVTAAHLPYPDPLQTVSNLTIENETVCLDNKHFENCTLLHCVLEYSGEELRIERTSFRGCRLKLSAGAGRTMQFLQCMGYMGEVTGDWQTMTPVLN